jgi:hypothetical protein
MQIPHKNRVQFQFHLSTSIAMMFATGGLFAANARVVEWQRWHDFFAQCRGWPLPAYLVTNTQVCSYEPTWIPIRNIFSESIAPVGPYGITRVVDYSGAIIDLLTTVAILVAIACISEWLARRRKYETAT